MKTAIILGGRSDIGRELAIRLSNEDWIVTQWSRDLWFDSKIQWDLIVCCLGKLKPIGKFFDVSMEEWKESVDSNSIIPLELLKILWPARKPGASVCFFSGAGTSKSAKTYSAYSASKIMLFKMTELLDDEEPDTKFFILGPGMVRTKIQQQTLKAGSIADNYERVKKFMSEGDELHKTGTSHERIYECLKWCLSMPKEVIGGRNIYVPDPFGPELEDKLRKNSNAQKLRPA